MHNPNYHLKVHKSQVHFSKCAIWIDAPKVCYLQWSLPSALLGVMLKMKCAISDSVPHLGTPIFVNDENATNMP